MITLCPGCVCRRQEVQPCNWPTWPATLFLTTNGNTYTLTKSGSQWFGTTRITVSAPIYTVIGCVPGTTTQVDFIVQCLNGVFQVFYTPYATFASTGGAPACGGNYCYFRSETFPVGSGGFGGRSNVNSFQNSPVVASGNWIAGPLLSSQPLCSLVLPFGNTAWSLTQ